MSSDTPSPRARLAARGLHPKNSFGQNFLSDAGVADKIAALATAGGAKTVIEIGAGTGALTVPLLARAERVIAIERDRDLVPLLHEDFATDVLAGRLEIVEADAKRFDYEARLTEAPGPCVITGNLPYQITGPLLETSVALAPLVERAVFMLQLEVADRLAAKAGDEAYGALSVFTQAAYAVERAFVVRPGSFYPRPGVDSAVVLLRPHSPPITRETPAFRAVVKAAFAQRRKTLRNAWRSLPGMTTESVARAAEAAGIDLDLRGETLDVRAFARMAERVAETEP